MAHFTRPHVIVSKCLEFDHCRYNGGIVHSDIVKQLMPHVDFTPVCPEMEIGLGVPRPSIQIRDMQEHTKLIQPATGLDVTAKMTAFSQKFLGNHPHTETDGFILKSKSPSCGIKDVRYYHGPKNIVLSSKNPGFFGDAVLTHFPHAAIEDEGRLRNPRIRDHFLTKLFTLSSFRQVKKSSSLKDLITFHTHNKFLLLGYNQKEMRILGRIVAHPSPTAPKATLKEYETHLHRALLHPPRCASNINVLMHSLGFVTRELDKEEKAFFLEVLENYRHGRIPLSVATHVLNSWMIRFKEDYLVQQTYFHPYPSELMDVESLNVCTTRDYWK